MRVMIDNGGTYQGRVVDVVRREDDGSLIVKHPTNPCNLLRLKPARVINGHDIRPQFLTLETEPESMPAWDDDELRAEVRAVIDAGREQ